ncbi:undecaprenyldiphospho-muramoylpentapeptide beta-N-acetylglucosaminyltransferase [Candidatus Sordicultor fermentans]|uniref:undecaprenyldiphospho-muramoylpentapeptide beta-N-acetylglucosaminyltransferase n=1 Tax=Candidatus Sordicultor fermentans TaxID=1953203 RepID=UPI0016BC1532|nr:undecaprenyldiphospho-muramoylpentapeptide beta-N-acetylglucosaminyltransferase [Candidatus Atribacteria bacterium]
MDTIFIAAGGTGGHIFPSLCIAQEIRKRGFQVIFLGTKRGMEENLLKEADFPLLFVRARGWNRKWDFSFFSVLMDNLIGFFQTAFYFFRYRPRALLGMGSYLSLLSAIWARVLGVPIYIHEQNIYPGLSNRLVSRWARKIFISAPEAIVYWKDREEKIDVVGNPLREEVMDWKEKKEEARQKLGLKKDRQTILVMGGSRGSEVINTTFLGTMDWLEKKGLQVIHITGEEGFEHTKEMAEKFSSPYLVYKFLPQPGIAYAAADLAIARAGANTIFELFWFELPSVLIPYGDATDDHQLYNAQWLEKQGLARVIEEKNLTSSLLIEEVEKILISSSCVFSDLRGKYLRESASQIAQTIIEELKRGKGIGQDTLSLTP